MSHCHKVALTHCPDSEKKRKNTGPMLHSYTPWSRPCLFHTHAARHCRSNFLRNYQALPAEIQESDAVKTSQILANVVEEKCRVLCIRGIALSMYAAFSDAFGRTAPFIWHQETIPLLFVPSKSNLEAKYAEVGVNKAGSDKWSGRIWQDGIHEMNILNASRCLEQESPKPCCNKIPFR